MPCQRCVKPVFSAMSVSFELQSNTPCAFIKQAFCVEIRFISSIMLQETTVLKFVLADNTGNLTGSCALMSYPPLI